MIRALTEADLLACAPLGLSFFSEANLPGRFIPSVFVESWTWLLSSGAGKLFGAFDGDRLLGAIGGVIAPDVNDGELVAQEMFWYVMPECRRDGITLLSTYLDALRAAGVKRYSLACLETMPRSVERYYIRLGLRPTERVFVGEFDGTKPARR